MLGMYVMGFQSTFAAYSFSILSAFGVVAAYTYIGASWLVMKTEGQLQKQAVQWAKKSGWICFIGVIAVSIVNPSINEGVYDIEGVGSPINQLCQVGNKKLSPVILQMLAN